MNMDDIPSSFEPVVWKDSMIFLATDEGPTQVQLWDTETRTLVKRYMFSTGDQYMYIGDMAVDKERFWINLVSRNETLVQVDVASGEVSRINLDIRPRYLQYIEGALWVFDPHSPWDGFKARRFNRNGVLEQSVTINRYDIDIVPYKSILYIDGDFLVPVRTNPDTRDDGICHYIINLSREGKMTPIPLETLYPGSLLENLSSVIYDSHFYPPDPNQSVLYWYHDAPGYADVLFLPSPIIWRWYYKVESYLPLKLSGPIITHHREGNRSNLYFNKTGEHFFIGGRLLSQLEDEPTYSGLEIGVYSAEGGEELSFFRLWNSNQITYAKINGETWFAKNIWSWDYEHNTWNFNGETEAYILDEVNVKLYRVRDDGVVVLVQ
jgi:hypothetical protein